MNEAGPLGSTEMQWNASESNTPPLPRPRKKSWKELHERVKGARKLQAKLTNMIPDMFSFREHEGKVRIYFLGVPPFRRDNTLMYCDVTNDGQLCPWKRLLDVSEPTDIATASLSKEEQLLLERKRSSLKGLTSYSTHPCSGRMVFSSNAKLHTCIDSSFTSEPLPVCTLNTLSEGSKLDPKICPSDPDLIAYVSNSDIWLYDLSTHQEHRLTYSRKASSSGVQTVSSGLPAFIIQEEFDRYTGYWWQPTDSSTIDGMYRILYEEVDETNVDVINIVSQTSESSGVEHYRYPRPGTTNAVCTLKLIEFSFTGANRQLSSSILDLRSKITEMYPWCEYIVRLDWCPDGQRIWVQLLDRSQQRLALVLIPLAYFVKGWRAVEGEVSASEKPQIIHEECTDIWINVDNCLTFIPAEKENTVRYIWASEWTGYKHLYHCVSDLNNPSEMNMQPLTMGDWQVHSSQQVCVDVARSLVYFTANKDIALETHLYCVSMVTGHIQRLTTQGFNHQPVVNETCSMVLSTYSSTSSNPVCNLYNISHTDTDVTLDIANVILQHTELDPGYQPPLLFTCPFKDDTDVMHAMVFKPHNFREGCKYPTVLYIYGGPQVQMVVNANRALRLIRLHTLASLGYVVVCLDGRGSIGRGLQWEGHIKGRMGMVEIADQIEGLEYLASTLGYIDMNRVAIHGWSYGGYMSLMGLTQRPDIFKVSISGAPVTKWEFYDTGYTERYMSTPSLNPTGYAAGSVLKSIDKFPDEENRLMLVHGMIDENVHLVHTTSLINELAKACKPYRLQLYPNERHGIRNPECGQHLETMILSFLQDNL